MRPIRLEIKGFSSFRERTEIDFSDAGLFVLFGPTGSGKSSIIDAMIFALYGTVPRLGDNQVAPLISKGERVAEVILDFAVGQRKYRAARFLRATSRGATTKEARLEQVVSAAGGEKRIINMASGARELTGRVESLLGLSCGQFEKAVALPQGAFAAFLQESSGERQRMLVNLLGLELFREIGRRSRSRASSCSVRLDYLTKDIEAYEAAEVSAESVASMKDRITSLSNLQEHIESLRGQVETLNERRSVLAADKQRHKERMRSLVDIAPPPELTNLARAIASAEAAHNERAEALNEAAMTSRTTGERMRDSSRDENLLLQALSDYDSLKQEQSSNVILLQNADEAGARARQAQTALHSTKEESLKATAALTKEENLHRARGIRRHLSEGDDCPVCFQRIDRLPEDAGGDILGQLRHEKTEADRAVQLAETAERSASSSEVEAKYAVNAASGRIEAIQRRLAGAAPEGVIRTRLQEIQHAKDAYEKAALEERKCSQELAAAENLVQVARANAAKAETRLLSLHESLAPLGAPALGGVNMLADWNALRLWSDDERRKDMAQIDQIERALAEVETARRDIYSNTVSACAEAGVSVRQGEAPSRLVAEEIGRMEVSAERMANDLNDLIEKWVERETTENARVLSEDLARLLGASQFEQWIMRAALTRLCRQASEKLIKLSGGMYSIEVDESNNFIVKDNAAGGERRSVRTLSGGETFLASLALALSLADNITQSAAQGVLLESLFIDEGFGTLDAEALDMVASVIEDVEASGRMVGVITHVSELADRIPLRYEVSKVGGSSSVRKHSALLMEEVVG
jgi:exonuclease SbcC